MSSKYSLVVVTVLMASFYAPALPVALIFAIVSLTVLYWADKYLLLRRTSLPFSLGSDLAESMIEHLEWAVFLYAAGNALIVYSLIDNTGQLAYKGIPKIWVWLSFIASLLHIFLPMAIINEKLFRIKDRERDEMPYTEAKSKNIFITDYDLLNPIQQEQVNIRQYKLQKKKTKEQKKVKDAKDAKDNIALAMVANAVDQEEQRPEFELPDSAQKTLENFIGSLEMFSERVDVEPRKARQKNRNPRIMKKLSALKTLTPQRSNDMASFEIAVPKSPFSKEKHNE